MSGEAIERIMAGLSEAQRKALIGAKVREPSTFVPGYRAIEMFYAGMTGAETDELRGLGLVTLAICTDPRGAPTYHGQIHDLGLAVRAALTQATPTDIEGETNGG